MVLSIYISETLIFSLLDSDNKIFLCHCKCLARREKILVSPTLLMV